MPRLEVYLDIPFHQQETDYFCGPAVAQMFLGWFAVNATQEDLWEAIKSNTGGSLPRGAGSDHSWPEQMCDYCENDPDDPWKCWDTTPEALQKTVTGVTSLTLGADYPSTFDEGVGLLIKSLDRSTPIPPFATMNAINHWVLVNGYRLDVQVGEQQLNGLYILDPQQADTTERIKFVTTGDWHSQFGLIVCGPHIDTYPVVVGEDRFPLWLPGAAAAAGALLLIALWWRMGKRSSDE